MSAPEWFRLNRRGFRAVALMADVLAMEARQRAAVVARAMPELGDRASSLADRDEASLRLSQAAALRAAASEGVGRR